jgi:hypothetical protein
MSDITLNPVPELKQVQLPFRRVHNRASFYLRQHIQSEVRQVEELTEHMVQKWYEFPRESCRELCEVINTTDSTFKHMCAMAKRMMYFCGFHLTFKFRITENKHYVIYEWKPMSVMEQERMISYETSIMPTKEQLEQQRKITAQAHSQQVAESQPVEAPQPPPS